MKHTTPVTMVIALLMAQLVPFVRSSSAGEVPDAAMQGAAGEQPAAADVAVHEQNGISYVNGGIAEEKQALEQMSKRFNFKLTMATPGGKFNTAALRIEDGQGRALVDLPEAGPLFLAKMPAGSYTVRVTPADGRAVIRKVTVPSSGQEQLAVTIPDSLTQPSHAGDAPE